MQLHFLGVAIESYTNRAFKKLIQYDDAVLSLSYGSVVLRPATTLLPFCSHSESKTVPSCRPLSRPDASQSIDSSPTGFPALDAQNPGSPAIARRHFGVLCWDSEGLQTTPHRLLLNRAYFVYKRLTWGIFTVPRFLIPVQF